MNTGLLLDITQIPTKLAGLAGVSKTLAVAALGFLIPFTILEMNVRSLQRKEFPSYSGLMTRGLVACMCLIAYKGLFGFILKLSQVMSFAILSEEQWGNFLTQSLKGSDSSYPTLMILLKNVASIQGLLLFLSSLLTMVVREVVIMLQVCFLSLLYAFGPLALACAVNEKTLQVTRGWITNTFQVAFWSFFLRLAVRVWLTLAPMSGSTGAGMADDYVGVLTVNVTFLILILGTPVLTARLLSGENIASMGEAAMGAVSTVMVARKMGAATSISKEISSYRKAKADGKGKEPYFQHPIPATMSRTYEAMFGRKKPAATDAAKPAAAAPRGKGA
ncbi:MAG: hypothetical protein SF051_06115 [Elusimicrobiota bacterium]|nr:hypothetical protein [Elusimicrobiota bacterium]